jgi:hypothetical protein
MRGAGGGSDPGGHHCTETVVVLGVPCPAELRRVRPGITKGESLTAERNRIRNRGPNRWYIMTDSWARAPEYETEVEAQIALDEINRWDQECDRARGDQPPTE